MRQNEVETDESKEMKEMSETLTSQITLNYREEWSEWEIVREIVQNALDETESLPLVEFKKDVTIMMDAGNGLSRGAFYLLGKTDGKDETKRGSKREGIKVGFARLLSKGGTVEAYSRDWKCTLQVGEKFDEKIVLYNFEELDEYYNGTKYVMTGLVQSDVEHWLDSRFVTKDDEDVIFHNTRLGSILDGEKAGKIYCKGIYVCESPKKSEFGYDLYNLNLNTDRNYPDYWRLTWRIGELLSQVQDREIIMRIIKACRTSTLESDAHIESINEWYLDILQEMFGQEFVPSTDAELRGKVAYEGGNMVTFQNEHLVKALERQGIKGAESYIEEKSEERRNRNLKSFDELGKKKQKEVKAAWSMMQKLEMFENTDWNVVIENDLIQFYDKYYPERGFGEIGGNKIALAIGECHSWSNIFPTMVHEKIHTDYAADDLSKEMQEKTQEAFRRFAKHMGMYRSKTALVNSLQ